MWDQYTMRIDEKRKERYKCKACSKEVAKKYNKITGAFGYMFFVKFNNK